MGVTLPRNFYTRNQVVRIAQELLGKVLCTKINGAFTAGIITETEAYAGISDRASHAYNNRRTPRTKVMFAEGGVAYVYFCYGMHHLFNVVTGKKNVPHAILIRSIKPVNGLKKIKQRRKRKMPVKKLCSGPGTVCGALGIKTCHTGTHLTGTKIWIEDRGIKISKRSIKKSPRIGIAYAGAVALLPYRFTIEI